MTTFSGPPSSAIRNKPISPELHDVLNTAGISAGIEHIEITSGGQDALGEGHRRTGSTRHDRGRAADLKLVVEGHTLTFSDHAAHPQLLAFVTAAAAAGASGIGAGVTYMGRETIHVGFGVSVNDHNKLTWGAQGRAANAPAWLRSAAAAGWNGSAPAVEASPEQLAAGRYVVIARSGLKLRGGPGTHFDSSVTLPCNQQLNVIDTGTRFRDWACVDLQSDGKSDGYVFASFLAPV